MQKAKERASILWLLSKACRKEVPDDLRNPYYKDAAGQDVLKPTIVQGLASCELYSLALSSIYEDPSYACLNHAGVIQLLMRKGVHLIEPHLSSLTETILIQNAPIRMNAHMLVMDAIQALFIKDILIPEQVVDVVSRFLQFPVDEVPLSIEEVALFWVNKCAERFKHLVDEELNRMDVQSIQYVPCVPPISDLTELSSGRQLLALLSFYCPEFLNWTEICLREQLSEEEAIANLEVLQYFCSKFLPYDICFLRTEDWLQSNSTLRINLLTFVADLMFLFEIKPAPCVRRPGLDDNCTMQNESAEKAALSASMSNGNISNCSTLRSRNNANAAEMKARSLRHTSWIEGADSDVSQSEHKLAKYFQPHQHLRQELYQPGRRDDHLDNSTKKRQIPLSREEEHQLSNELHSLHVNSKDDFYLNDSNYSHNSQAISFATLSKINESCGSQKENHNQLNQLNQCRPAINVAYERASDKQTELETSLGTETEIGGQIMEIRMKLEEKRRQIELERRQQEDTWKTQRHSISKEAFLKALKKEKNLHPSTSMYFANKSHDHDEQRSNGKNEYFSRSSMDIISDSKREEESLKNGQFFLHKDDNANTEIVYEKQPLQNQSIPPHLAKHFQEYLNQQNGDRESNNSFRLLNDISTQDSPENKITNGLTEPENSVREEKISNNNNNEKGFFILFDDVKKPRPMPPTLRSKLQQAKSEEPEKQKSPTLSTNPPKPNSETPAPAKSIGFVIGPDLVSPDPMTELEKAKKKELIVIQSLRRRAQQETQRMIKEDELSKKRELERKKRESADKRKEESRQRREAILEQYKVRKLQEDSEKDGKSDSRLNLLKSGATLRNRGPHSTSRISKGRPKSIHVSNNIQAREGTSNLMSLENFRPNKLVSDHLDAALINYPSVISNYATYAGGRPQSSLSTNSAALKKLSASSIASKHNLPSLPPFLISNKLNRGSGSSDGVSEIGSTYSEYTGPKLYVKPTQKSNRGIIVNAINVVLGGAVNAESKKKVLEEITNHDSKHFLILFRGAGMQFRAIYSYNPDLEEIVKLYGTGPKNVNNDMIDKFYKYNSGAKNFNEVHTKHLTVTIDAITIHNVLWSGKRVPPPKKDPF